MAGLDETTRAALLADPAAVLEDREVMGALIAARDADVGANVIDIRGRAMAALEDRLDRLEAAHESVISAAYDNQSGMAVVHRAVLALLEPMDAPAFVTALDADVAPILRLETLRLVIEDDGTGADFPEEIVIVPEGAIARLIAAGRRAPRGDDIVLRRAQDVTARIHGRAVASEALVPLDLGEGLPPALMVMGSAEPGRFTPAQGTDLLRFFGQVFRLVLMGWLRR